MIQTVTFCNNISPTLRLCLVIDQIDELDPIRFGRVDVRRTEAQARVRPDAPKFLAECLAG